VGIEQRVEVNSPLALVVLMLGTNDFQAVHQFTASQSAQGLGTLVQAIRQAPIEPAMPIPAILIVAPPPIHEPKGAIAPKFEGATSKSAGLAAALSAIAKERDCEFFDAATVTTTSRVDGVHLDADQHERLGLAMAGVVGAILQHAVEMEQRI
jgi:lysophospholipase L1-like esterase